MGNKPVAEASHKTGQPQGAMATRGRINGANGPERSSDLA